jgi:hypothetical protein
MNILIPDGQVQMLAVVVQNNAAGIHNVGESFAPPSPLVPRWIEYNWVAGHAFDTEGRDGMQCVGAHKVVVDTYKSVNTIYI